MFKAIPASPGMRFLLAQKVDLIAKKIFLVNYVPLTMGKSMMFREPLPNNKTPEVVVSSCRYHLFILFSNPAPRPPSRQSRQQDKPRFITRTLLGRW